MGSSSLLGLQVTSGHVWKQFLWLYNCLDKITSNIDWCHLLCGDSFHRDKFSGYWPRMSWRPEILCCCCCLIVLVVVGLCCYTQAFSNCSEQGLLVVAVHRLLPVVASLVEPGPSVVVMQGLSCSVACGIFLDQGLNSRPLHWQTDSYPLHHRGSPTRNSFSSVELLSRVQLFATPCIAAHQASLSITNSWSSLKLTSIESMMPPSHLILCRPLLLLPPIPPSIRVFSNESTLCMRWPKYWSFSFSIIPSKEIPGLISFRMDWLDLLAVQGTLKGLLQHHSSKASILRRSAFFTVQLSHPYMTTGKTRALTRWTFVGK